LLTDWEPKEPIPVGADIEIEVIVSAYVDRRGQARYNLAVKSERANGEPF
jgi:hypothetical protein